MNLVRLLRLDRYPGLKMDFEFGFELFNDSRVVQTKKKLKK